MENSEKWEGMVTISLKEYLRLKELADQAELVPHWIKTIIEGLVMVENEDRPYTYDILWKGCKLISVPEECYTNCVMEQEQRKIRRQF